MGSQFAYNMNHTNITFDFAIIWFLKIILKWKPLQWHTTKKEKKTWTIGTDKIQPKIKSNLAILFVFHNDSLFFCFTLASVTKRSHIVMGAWLTHSINEITSISPCEHVMWLANKTHTHTQKNETLLKQSNNNCIVSTAFINPFPLNVNWMILNTDRWFHFECFVLKRKEWLSFTCLIICSHLLNRLNLFTIRQNGWRS